MVASPSWSSEAVHASAGRAAIAASSTSVIVQPTVNRTVRRPVFIRWRCSSNSCVAPAPSMRTRIFRR
jgi:hypothetical protein